MANRFGGVAMILSTMLSTQATAQSPPVYGFRRRLMFYVPNRLTSAWGNCPRNVLLVGARLHYCLQRAFTPVGGPLKRGNESESKLSDDKQQSLLETLCLAKPEQDFSRAAMQLLDKIRQADGLESILKN
jgi:hypothetical protein